jgi:hypothetical protein
MSRRLLISTLAFLLAMLGGVASACSTAGSHQGTGQQAGSSAGALVKLPETANVEYGEVTDLPPDAKAQTITFKDITGRAEDLGCVRTRMMTMWRSCLGSARSGTPVAYCITALP